MCNLRMRSASVDLRHPEQHRLSRTLCVIRYGRKPGNTAASSHGDSVSWPTPALEFLHIVWTKREMTHREKLVWMAKQKSRGKPDIFLNRLRPEKSCPDTKPSSKPFP